MYMLAIKNILELKGGNDVDLLTETVIKDCKIFWAFKLQALNFDPPALWHYILYI